MAAPEGRGGAPDNRGKAVFAVSIGASALDDRAAEPALRRALHEELLEDLMVHGQLVFASEEDLQDFVTAVGRLPTSLAKAWETVLSSRRVSVGVADPAVRPGLAEMLDPANVEQRLGRHVELVLVEAAQAELLGVPEDEFSSRTPQGGIEIGRISTATRTVTVRKAREVLESPLRAGDNREYEWAARFEPLVAAGQPLVIYDRYLGQQAARRYVYQRGSGDGLTWFLGKVAMRPGRRVRIITSITDRRDGNEVYDERVTAVAFRRLRDELGRPLRIDLVLVPDRIKERGRPVSHRFGHDRHLRFGNRTALALGTGMQSFAEARFPETITVARLPVADAKAREELALRAALRPPQGGWLDGAL